jgi:hypothetical protein
VIKKFEQFEFDPYGEEIWEDDTDINGYREIAVKLGLEPTDFWRMDPDLDDTGFSFFFHHNGKKLIYDVIHWRKWNTIEIHIVDRETLEPEDYGEEVLASEELHGDTDESFIKNIINLALKI